MDKLIEGKIYNINGKQWRFHGTFKIREHCARCGKVRNTINEFLYPDTPYGDNWNGFLGGDDEPLRLGTECVKKLLNFTG